MKLNIHRLQSGPLGGDQQVGAMITEGKIDLLIFFRDPLEPLPLDPDILAVLWNIPMACNRTTADYIFSSHLLFSDYERVGPDFAEHLNRRIEE